MCKTSFIIVIMLAICLSGNVRAQEIDFSVQVVSAQNEHATNGKIVITMTKGNPPYTVYLFDRAPWKGGKELRKSEDAMDETIELDNLLSGDYYIIVEDGDRNPQAKAVHVGMTPE